MGSICNICFDDLLTECFLHLCDYFREWKNSYIFLSNDVGSSTSSLRYLMEWIPEPVKVANYSCFYNSESCQLVLVPQRSNEDIKEFTFSFLRSDVEWHWEIPTEKLNMDSAVFEEHEYNMPDRDSALNGSENEQKDYELTLLPEYEKAIKKASQKSLNVVAVSAIGVYLSAYISGGRGTERTAEIDRQLMKSIVSAKTEKGQNVLPFRHKLQLNTMPKLRNMRYTPRKSWLTNTLSIERYCA